MCHDGSADAPEGPGSLCLEGNRVELKMTATSPARGLGCSMPFITQESGSANAAISLGTVSLM